MNDNVVGWFKRQSDGAVIIIRHRTKETAEKAIERVCKRHRVEPKAVQTGHPPKPAQDEPKAKVKGKSDAGKQKGDSKTSGQPDAEDSKSSGAKEDIVAEATNPPSKE